MHAVLLLLILLQSLLYAQAGPAHTPGSIDGTHDRRLECQQGGARASPERHKDAGDASHSRASLPSTSSSWQIKGIRSRRAPADRDQAPRAVPGQVGLPSTDAGLPKTYLTREKQLALEEISHESDDDQGDLNQRQLESEDSRIKRKKRRHSLRQKQNAERDKKFDEIWQQQSMDDLGPAELAYAVKCLEMEGKSRQSIAQAAKAKIRKEYTAEFQRSYTEYANRLVGAMKQVKKSMMYRGAALPTSREELVKLAREHIERRERYRQERQQDPDLARRRQAYREKIKPAQIAAIDTFRRHLREEKGIQQDMDTLTMRELERHSRRYPDDLHARKGFTKHLFRHLEELEPNGKALLQEFKTQRLRYNKKLPQDPLEKAKSDD